MSNPDYALARSFFASMRTILEMPRSVRYLDGMDNLKQQLMRIRDIQVILGCSRSFVVQLIEAGTFRQIKLTPTTIRVPRADVEAYLASFGIESEIA